MGTLRHLSAMARLVARGLSARGTEACLPLRRPALERTVEAPRAERLGAYLRATGGERVARNALPPLFPATWETALALELLAGLDPPLPPAAVVHASSELVQVRPIEPGERVRSRVALESAEPARAGLRLTVATRAWNPAGQLCTEGSAVYVVRTRAPAAGDRPGEPPGGPRLEPEWREAARWRLAAGAGRRYALASGDLNPIHLWGWTARPFGFPRPILHGWCTAARVAHALVVDRFGGDPTALRRLAVSFRAPLPLPAEAVLWLAETARERRFRVTDPSGDTIHAEGHWAGGVPSPSIPPP